jgi:hypothetical protein
MKNKVFKDYKDIHKGKRVFLVANGPSLAETNLNLLENEISFAMNRIPLIYNKNPNWRPTYYLFSSTNVRPDKPWSRGWTDSVLTAIGEEKTTPFIASQFKQYIDPAGVYDNVKWFDSMSEIKPDQDGNISETCFSTNVVERIDKTGTTMNLALQLCYHMGFSEIVFVGADLGWTMDRGSNKDPNHFDPGYTADISKPEKANHQMRNVHSLAYKKLNEKNKDIKMYNASKKTVLDVYQIIDFEEYVLNNNVVNLEEKNTQAESHWNRPSQFDSWKK